MNNDSNYYTLTKAIVKYNFLSGQVITMPEQVKENFTCQVGHVDQKLMSSPVIYSIHCVSILTTHYTNSRCLSVIRSPD